MALGGLGVGGLGSEKMRSMHVRHRSSICVLDSRGSRGDGVIYGDVLLKPELGVDTCVVFSLFWFLLHGLAIDPHFRKSSTVTGTMSTAKNVCISFISVRVISCIYSTGRALGWK